MDGCSDMSPDPTRQHETVREELPLCGPTRYTWVFFLKKKDETQQIFIDFATEVQRQHNLTILAIRSDNGSEFKNYTLNDFLSDEGIRHQYSAAYTPQQNGVAERKNRTLMDMASVTFEENDGSQVGQVDVCADDEIPQDAIVRMGTGFHLPIEGHGVAPREGLCSTQVEPSSSQAQQAPDLVDNVTPTEEQAQDPPSHEQDQGQDQPNEIDGEAPSVEQEQPNDDGATPNDVQDQPHDTQSKLKKLSKLKLMVKTKDQVMSQSSFEDIEAHRKIRVARTLELRGHTIDKVIGDLRKQMTTRRQLANFSDHQAYISMVEPKKVFDALEDPDWLDAMHEELNNFKRNKTHLRRGKGVQMDVMDFLWNQIYLRMVEKRSPSFAPYIMKLISEVWPQKFDGAILEPISPLTEHPRKNLLIKDHGLLASATSTTAPTTGPSSAPACKIDGFTAHMALGENPNSIYDPLLEPSWYTKLKIKVKKTFCLQLDIQERMYDSYVAEKKAQRRQKSIMSKLGVEVSPP
ncbi:hypothetical protein QYE76_042502 [Lolium multiflorum]|uniref:Integrase catalytic domain-containing protein n=1 Tax=Lolium multiflorum TaxID=4521 RepID=A0AAD8TFD0_LOLMU|nr:hypothetical protein QYE76_042502 [Lolium multiflorum]